MARISMRNVQKSTVEEYFSLYLSSAAAKGVKDKTLETYKNHFRSISKRMNTTIPMNRLTSQDLEEMILKMREEGLSASSINSYTRTLKVFFSWCNEEGHSHLNIKLYKAPESCVCSCTGQVQRTQSAGCRHQLQSHRHTPRQFTL